MFSLQAQEKQIFMGNIGMIPLILAALVMVGISSFMVIPNQPA